jgi:hypothetical protein
MTSLLREEMPVPIASACLGDDDVMTGQRGCSRDRRQAR